MRVESDVAQRAIRRRDKLLKKMEHFLSLSSCKLRFLERDVAALKYDIRNKLEPKCEAREKAFNPDNPSHLRRAFGNLDPVQLVKCYSRPRRYVRWEDEMAHPLFTNPDAAGAYSIKTRWTRPPIIFRDYEGRPILAGLEVLNRRSEAAIAGRHWKDVEAEIEREAEGKLRRRSDDELLFNRNWPLVERRGGQSIREFIRY